MGSSSSLYLQQPFGYLTTVVFSLSCLGRTVLVTLTVLSLTILISWFLPPFLWCTEPLTAKVGLHETLTIHTKTELLWKSSSAILAKFSFATLRKCWAGTACALESSGAGGKEERRKWGEKINRVLLSVPMLPPRGWEQWGSIPAVPDLLGVLSVYFVSV